MKLRLRWSLWMLGLIPLLLVVDLAAMQWSIRRAAREQDREHRGAIEAELQSELSQRALTLRRASDRLLADPEFSDWAHEPVAQRSWIERAALWRDEAGADQLLLLDSRGLVLASSLHPESYGLRHPSADFLLAALDGAPILYEEWGTEERPIHLAAGARDGGRLLLIAQRVDAQWLARGREEHGLRRLRWRESVGVQTPSDFQLQRPWALEFEAVPAAAASTLRALAREILVVQAILVALAIVVALWLGHWTARPVERLAHAVHSLRSGQSRQFETGPGGNELDRLSRDVAAMADELNSAQQERLAAERRGAWREVAQRIAHEIKNVLSPLSLALDNLETTAGRQDEQARAITARSLQTAREQLTSLDRLVGEFRSFARIPPPTLRELDVVALCRAAADALREAFPDQRLTILESPALHGVRGDSELLRRALGNLLRNAAEAAPRGSIELAWGEGPGPTHWWCSVRDDGPGLPAEILARWDGPVQSGKPGGSGLGLSIVTQTLTAHGGRLHARNRREGGCEMRWELPKQPSGFVGEGEHQP